MPMLRSGSNDLGEAGVGVACGAGGGTGDVGPVAFMKPKADPGTAVGAAVLAGGSEGAASPVILFTVMFPNRSLEPPFTAGVEVVALATLIPPKKSFCCCGCATTGAGEGVATGAAAAVGCSGAGAAALVFNPLNKADGAPVPGAAWVGTTGVGTGAACSSKSNRLVGGATGAAAGAANAGATPFAIAIPPSMPNAANTLLAGAFTLALA
mmetsp:Transcript_23327/g.44230  ORF Transcript_23327/g.44230 Transcript_23327/m.44230 type:complete len:210 (-) Transcript_23327:1343-1972(-)